MAGLTWEKVLRRDGSVWLVGWAGEKLVEIQQIVGPRWPSF